MNRPAQTLVVLSPAFPANDLEDGVISQQLFVKTLRKKFPELNVIVLAFQYPPSRSIYSWHGVTVIPFDGMHRGRNRLALLWRIWRTLKKLANENNIIGLFSFWCGECALVGTWFGKWNSIRHICWICGQDAREPNKMVKFIRPKAQDLVAMSNFLVEEFEKNHKIRPAHVIPNAIDENSFSGSRPERDIDILGAGSLHPLKQYDFFATVVKAVQQKMPAVRAIHCGMASSEENKKMQSQIAELGLRNNLQLLGPKSHKEVLELMQRTKVFLHPSSYEGYSTTCLEALYAGAHVVSFCDPMDGPISQWHIVHSRTEMIDRVNELLHVPNLEHRSVSVHSMDDTVQGTMNLFTPNQVEE